MNEFLGWYDILHGVGELVVDEAKLAVRAIFRMPHEGISDHFTTVTRENVDELLPPTLWDDMGNYHDL